MTIRLIPRLDIKGPNLVKGIHLEGLRVLGRPEEFARSYYEVGADELIYMDVVAWIPAWNRPACCRSSGSWTPGGSPAGYPPGERSRAVPETKRQVAIVDYGMCNLFSVQRACEHVGLASFVTSDPAALRAADAAILPGVGAFGEAMRNMGHMGLDDALRDLVARGRPLLGICLGMQMILSQSEEFGDHRGLDLVPGRVVKFALPVGDQGRIRVPQIGWNRLAAPPGHPACWADTPLRGVADGEYMYFVHSFYAVPRDPGVVLSRTTYSGIEYCSSFRKDRIFATQFHPEKSGPAGIMIYRNFKSFCNE